MPDEVVMLDMNVAEILSHWGFHAGDFDVIGVVTSGLEGHTRPILAIGGNRYLLRRQSPDLTEDDTIFRHAFMGHLAAQRLPVPAILPRPDGATHAVVEEAIYELQGWGEGRRYVTGDPGAEDQLAWGAGTLGAMHQAAADFPWRPHRWPEDRSAPAFAVAYVNLIQERGASAALPESVGNGLLRVAEGCAARIEPAVQALESPPRPPDIHLHGDYQPHNLAFGPTGVSAIYDFDAAHYGRRLDELAYALLFFCGVRWDDAPTVTPPLVPDGLDTLAVHRFLAAYGREAPPAEGEAALLADALALAFPAVFANGVAEDLIFPEDYEGELDEEDALSRLQWADSFWLWLDRYRDTLAQAWENA